jgi:hypothetical protein
MLSAAQLRAARAAPASPPPPPRATLAAAPAPPLHASAPQQVGCAATLRRRRAAPRAVAAAAGAGTKDRGEWTRFLEWSADDARASVDCELLSGGAAAEVTVVAPDRPGLLSDITATIASLGLNIERVRARALRAAPRADSRPASRATLSGKGCQAGASAGSPARRRVAHRLRAAVVRACARPRAAQLRAVRTPLQIWFVLPPRRWRQALTHAHTHHRTAGEGDDAGQQGEGHFPGDLQDGRADDGGAHVLHSHRNHQRRLEERPVQGCRCQGAFARARSAPTHARTHACELQRGAQRGAVALRHEQTVKQCALSLTRPQPPPRPATASCAQTPSVEATVDVMSFENPSSKPTWIISVEVRACAATSQTVAAREMCQRRRRRLPQLRAHARSCACGLCACARRARTRGVC